MSSIDTCEGCRFYMASGCCGKTHSRQKYRLQCPSKDALFSKWKTPYHIRSMWRVCEDESPWGNNTVLITKKDIDSLLCGDVLTINDGEYTTFIAVDEVENDG